MWTWLTQNTGSTLSAPVTSALIPGTVAESAWTNLNNNYGDTGYSDPSQQTVSSTVIVSLNPGVYIQAWLQGGQQTGNGSGGPDGVSGIGGSGFQGANYIAPPTALPSNFGYIPYTLTITRQS